MQTSIIMERLSRFWDVKEVRILVVASLCLQFLLVFLSHLRKRSANKVLTFLLWSSYQVADYIPILALSDILRKQYHQGGGALMAFWAPFFLLHLGGSDMMTSYSIEDNELWLRHLMGLVSQAVIVFLVMLKLLAIPRLFAAAAFVFVTGFVKYTERTLALRSASMNQMKDSVVNNPASDHEHCGFPSSDGTTPNNINDVIKLIADVPSSDGTTPNNINDVKLIADAYESLRRFKPELFQMIVGGDKLIDLVANFKEKEISQTYFLNSSVSDAFKVLEIELSFLYDVFHSKAIHIRGIRGAIWRFISLGMISIALIIFHNCEKQGYVSADIKISYTLLGSALFMEFCSLVAVTISDWMIVALTRHTWLNKLPGVISFLSKGKPRWGKAMNVYNLLGHSLQAKRKSRILGPLKVEEFWDPFRSIYRIHIPVYLKYHFYEYLSANLLGPDHTNNFKEFPSQKGQRALQSSGCSHLGWSVDKEFDESIVIWHVATDICFYGSVYSDYDKQTNLSRELSRKMSEYIVYLLMMQPSMMPAGSRQISFQDTWTEAKVFFQAQKGLDGHTARTTLFRHVEKEVDPKQVKGDRSKSVLFDACRLAKELRLLPRNERWDLISRVWVEMLGYAAINCKTHHHVKRLNQGGEFLTHLWLLMAHMGIGMKYHDEEIV